MAGSKNDKRNTNTNSPTGKSYMDVLPDNILDKIYYYQHQLNFKDSLDFIKKLRIALDTDMYDSKVPIKKLLTKATDNNLIYIYRCW